MKQLGLHTAILPNMSFEEVVDYSAKVGFETLEVCCWPKGKAERRYAGVVHIDVDELSKEKADYYVNYALNKGITIAALAYFPNPLSDDEAVAHISREHLLKVINAAAMMNVNLVTTFIGKNRLKTVEDNIVEMKKVWPPILSYAKQRNVQIAIENCPMYYTQDEWPGGNNLASTPVVWDEMLEMGNNIGLCFDPSHMILLGMNVIKPVVDYKDRLFHVHFKDLQLDQDKIDRYGRFSYPGLWHTPKIPGLGDVNFAKLISKLNEIGYQGACCLECEDRAFEGSDDDIKICVETAYRYLRTLM